MIIGVVAAGARTTEIVIASTAGLVAGAMSMAAGEYVAVRAQSDTEKAALAQAERELATNPAGALAKLAGIYAARGFDATTALAVATRLMARDALSVHARDERDISVGSLARPVQAAFVSAASFTLGAAMPLLATLLVPAASAMAAVAASSLILSGDCRRAGR